MTPEQMQRASDLVAMGVPLPMALAIAQDPQAAARGAQDGVALFNRGANALLDLPGKALKRKPSAYNRRYAAAYRRIKRSKTLKSGKMAKGFSGTSGHKKIVKLAHAAAKKKGRKR